MARRCICQNCGRSVKIASKSRKKTISNFRNDLHKQEWGIAPLGDGLTEYVQERLARDGLTKVNW